METTIGDVSRWLRDITGQDRGDHAEGRREGLYGLSDGTTILGVLPADGVIFWRTARRGGGTARLLEGGVCPVGDTQPILDAWQRASRPSDDGEAA